MFDSYTVEKKRIDELTEIHIARDEYSMSPRKFGPMTTMVGFHGEYDLTDSDGEWAHDNRRHFLTSIFADTIEQRGFSGDFEDLTPYQMREVALSYEGIIKEIHILDNFGYTSVRDFSEQKWEWPDAFVYITPEKIKYEYNVLNDETREKAESVMDDEMDIFSKWMMGDCYVVELRRSHEGDCQCSHVEWSMGDTYGIENAEDCADEWVFDVLNDEELEAYRTAEWTERE